MLQGEGKLKVQVLVHSMAVVQRNFAVRRVRRTDKVCTIYSIRYMYNYYLTVYCHGAYTKKNNVFCPISLRATRSFYGVLITRL